MSVLETASPITCRHFRPLWKRRRGMARYTEVVCCMWGDTANLAEIDGIDFDVVNKDLIDYYYEYEDE